MTKPDAPGITASEERNVIRFLKKMATDEQFVESLRNATTVAARREVIERAGIAIDFTNTEVMQHIDRMRLLAAHARGAAAPPSGAGAGVEQRLSDVIDALAVVVAN